MLARVFPTLLLDGRAAIKTIKFSDPRYIGDPVNAARIFNAYEVDELAILDKSASREGRTIHLDIVQRISDECFMPLLVGGGIRSLDDIRNAINAGAEKVSISSNGVENPDFLQAAVAEFGSSTIVVTLDYRTLADGSTSVFTLSGQKDTGKRLLDAAREIEALGVGEIILNSIDRDGTRSGYDVENVRSVAEAVGVPIIALGGAGNLQHIGEVIKLGKAAAATAGSLFVYWGRRQAVLMNFPRREELEAALA